VISFGERVGMNLCRHYIKYLPI